MIQLYDNGADRYIILGEIRALSPVVAEVFPCLVELEVGALFSKVGTSNLVTSFLSDHENAKVEELLGSGYLSVFERTSNGAIFIGVKSLDVEQSLAGEKVNLLGHQIAFKTTSFLDTCHYVDVFRSFWVNGTGDFL
uniref:Uncharacterized protein n=1 Tax=Hyaloperonospora arabidopsidis (strain Emoy2) TaxID=559515 RepID=M4BTI1_HYAAE